jgi:hypothetical protein
MVEREKDFLRFMQEKQRLLKIASAEIYSMMSSTLVIMIISFFVDSKLGLNNFCNFSLIVFLSGLLFCFHYWN